MNKIELPPGPIVFSVKAGEVSHDVVTKAEYDTLRQAALALQERCAELDKSIKQYQDSSSAMLADLEAANERAERAEAELAECRKDKQA